MFRLQPVDSQDSDNFYAGIHLQLTGLLTGERDWLANLANFSSLLFHLLPDLNWVGFYLFNGTELVLGPFQGKPACTRIALNRGVCGTAAATRSVQRVADVHQFPGHITCDAASRSELVVPLLGDDRLLGVLDLDSPLPDRFTAHDAAQVTHWASELVRATDWPDRWEGDNPR